ncbi:MULTISPECIES: hypothetical protein [unclassified Streptomyces]|uniref:hypothetical protein n=1 Tax=unclassified Streptomyces TaxID=2593676 RepID=UPI002E2DC746|nr:hypothetical protein [Streptomyces sp. NBC_00272]
MTRHLRRRALAPLAVLSAPALALLVVVPAAARPAATVPATVTAPSICHGLTQGNDPYHVGCRQGYLEGSSSGNRDGKPPLCHKTLPPLIPPNPTAFVQGKVEGYRYGYNQAYAKSAAANKAACDALGASQSPTAPKPPAQTEDSMFAAGKASGETWGRQEGTACDLARKNARLVPQKVPNTLILAFQNGYAVGYDTAYDEAYRQHCLNK